MERLVDFKIFTMSVLGYLGSISALDGSTLKEEAHAQQCITAGPYNAIPTYLPRAGTTCGRKISVYMSAQIFAHRASVLRNFVDPITTQTCGACGQCNRTERTRDENDAQPSKCNSQYMSWTWFTIIEADCGMVYKGTRGWPGVSRVSR